MVISAGPCRPGSFHSNNAGLCSKCHINTYTNSTGSKECLKCPDGTTTFSKGSTECEAYTCQVTDVRGFLKYKCVTSSGVDFYRCWNSAVIYQVTIQTCTRHHFTDLCEDDRRYYQLCGLIPCDHKIDDKYGFCGNYICDMQSYDPFSEVSVRDFYTCDGNTECSSNKADELDCEDSINEEEFICSHDTIRSTISVSKVCDGHEDCKYATEEAHCNHTYGVRCNRTFSGITVDGWLPPYKVCNGDEHCDRGEDEKDCGNSTHASWCKLDKRTKYLNERQLCGPVDYYSEKYFCDDHRDQLNCSNSVMECQVENFTTSLRMINLCDGFKACDNEIDEDCLTPEQSCTVHKHQMCNNLVDCKRGSDENHELCNNMIDEECERLVIGNNTKIPLDWLCDGVVDCKDGKDEDRSEWKLCGAGDRQRCRPKSHECEEQFICPQSKPSQYVEFEKLCDNVDSCSGENSICQTAQDIVEPLTTTPDLYGSKRVGYCLPGLDSPELNCSKTVFTKLENVSKTIVKPFSVNIPLKELRCKHMFGEAYVYTSCSNRCLEKDVICPLLVLNSSSCISMGHKIMLPSLSNQLTMVKRKKGSYDNAIFPCKNGNCISYKEVCNLADNCGDGSDEDECINHIKCNFSARKYFRVESRCDGRIDCSDLSDECNGQCGERIINDPNLQKFAWVVGILASLINAAVLAKNGRDIFGAESKVQLMNSTMILLIAFGDLLIGIYLLSIVITDHLYNTDYCPKQLQWLVSRKCSLLGILSTIGSQVSLFSMTCLSLYRANSMRNLLAPRHLSRKAVVTTFLVGASILIASTAIAVLPELGVFEDYFINGMYYRGSPVFTGTPGKQKHLDVIEKRFGRFSQIQEVSWGTIRTFVAAMFTKDHNEVEGKSLGFYGNDGVCLFKFFVKPDDPQHMFSLSIMMLNFICFILITGSYIIINYISMASSAASSDDSATNERSRKMQRKITVIILTDFVCWVPFIVIGMLHFSGTIDATKYYGLCSIVVLPLNSVVNPMLYDGSVVDIFTTVLSRGITFARTFTSIAEHQSEAVVVRNPAVAVETLELTEIADSEHQSEAVVVRNPAVAVETLELREIAEHQSEAVVVRNPAVAVKTLELTEIADSEHQSEAVVVRNPAVAVETLELREIAEHQSEAVVVRNPVVAVETLELREIAPSQEARNPDKAKDQVMSSVGTLN